MQRWLTRGGVRRICAGHLCLGRCPVVVQWLSRQRVGFRPRPHGDSPLILRFEAVGVEVVDCFLSLCKGQGPRVEIVSSNLAGTQL